MRMSLLSVIVLCCRIRSSNEARCCEVKGDVGIVAAVREEERIDLRYPMEQAFGQRDAKVEVGIEGLVRLFCCSLWHGKTSVIGGLEFRCFPIGGIGASTILEDVCLLKSPSWLCCLTLCVLEVLGEFVW